MDYENARANMVNQQVRSCGTLDQRVLDALGSIPREKFVPAPYKGVAYSDNHLPLSDGHWLLSPLVIGRMLQALNLQSSERVLELDAGTGYGTLCLSRLAASVCAVESDPGLAQESQRLLAEEGADNVIFSDAEGWRAHKPEEGFAAIVVNKPHTAPSKAWFSALAEGGKLFAVIGSPSGPVMRAQLFHGSPEGQIRTQYLFDTVLPGAGARERRFVL